MIDMPERRMCYFGICAIFAYQLIQPIGHNGSSQVVGPGSTRDRLADAFEKVAPLLDKKHYDEAGAILREIAISRTQDNAGGVKTDGWTGIKGGPDKVDIQ